MEKKTWEGFVYKVIHYNFCGPSVDPKQVEEEEDRGRRKETQHINNQ